MLQSMRDNSQGIVAKILVGLIIVVFALWGIDSLVGLATKEPAPAEVNGVEVTQQDLFRGVELQRRQILTQLGQNADPRLLDDNLLRSSVLNTLVDRTLSMESAESQGVFVSEQMLDQLIVTTPEFQVNGSFDRNQFEVVLRNAGYTPLSYRKLLREETLIAQERRAYTDSAFMTQTETQRLLDLNRQSRDLRYFSVKPDPEAVTVSEQEVSEAYNAGMEQFMTEEKLVVNYLVLDRKQFSNPNAVTEDELNTAYQQLVADFKGKEERKASHILFEVSDMQDENSALTLAKEVSAEIEAGADFGEMAAKYSKDTGSANAGGDLGYISAGLFDGPFDEALMSLKAGEISKPVVTDFGIHLIRVTDIRSTEPPTLAEAESDLRERIANDKAETQYVAALERFADLSFSSGDLQVPAEELNLKVQQSEPFGRNSGTDIFANARVVDAAFSDTVLKEQLNSDPIELDSGRTLVVHLNKQIPARQQTLDEVRELLVNELKQTRAVEVAGQQAQTLLESARQGDPSIEWVAAKSVTRGVSDLDPQLVEAAFALAEPAVDKTFFTQIQLRDGSSVVLTVDSVGMAEERLPEDQQRSVAQMLAKRRGELSYQNQFDAYKAESTIVIN